MNNTTQQINTAASELALVRLKQEHNSISTELERVTTEFGANLEETIPRFGLVPFLDKQAPEAALLLISLILGLVVWQAVGIAGPMITGVSVVWILRKRRRRMEQARELNLRREELRRQIRIEMALLTAKLERVDAQIQEHLKAVGSVLAT